jgi:hypothetical protein
MKHLRIYEDYQTENIPIVSPVDGVHFETESSEIESISGSEGNYKVSFQNSDGDQTTIEIGGAYDPEFIGDNMVSSIEMIPDSSSDGKSYSITGYYDLVPDSGGAYEIKKVLIEEK